MLPDPLHPAVVHFPLALAVLLPLAVAAAFLLISLGCRLRHAWGPVVALQVLLVASAWAAVETGEDQEDIVEPVIGEQYVEAHEDLAERLLYLAWLGLGLSGLGVMSGRRGAIGRTLYTIATVALLATAVQVGRTGGDMVYKHGAAQAYTSGGNAAVEPGAGDGGDSHDDDDSDDD